MPLYYLLCFYGDIPMYTGLKSREHVQW